METYKFSLLFRGLLLLPPALLVFFVVALVKACTRKTAGWIVSSILSGVLLLGFIVAVLIGAFFSVKSDHPRAGAGAMPESPAINVSPAPLGPKLEDQR